MRPGLFRCDFKKPRESYNIIADNVAYLILPKLKQVEKYVFDNSQETRRHIHRLLIGINVSTKEILSWYDVEYLDAESKPGIAALRFVPKSQDDSGIESICLWVNTETGQPAEWLIDEGEDQKRIIVRKMIVDKPVDPKIFDPEKYFGDYEIIEKIY
jgi:outer membrane lipoprotein-sorting protein